MNSVFKKCGMSELAPRFTVGGSDAAYVTKAGIPCVDSLGPCGDYIHSTREFVRLDSIVESAKRIASVCFYL